jgi:iron complex outermembrane receptor protein
MLKTIGRLLLFYALLAFTAAPSMADRRPGSLPGGAAREESEDSDDRPGAVPGTARDEPDNADARPGRSAVPGVADTVYWTPEIVVEAERLRAADHLLDRSGFVALIELGDAHRRFEDAVTLLSRLTGVRVLQYGGLGSYATVSIRGSSANQVLLFLDGVPLNNAYLGIANIADLPLGDLHRIEIYRGFSPPHLGSSAIGGAINLVSFGGEAGEGTKLTAGATAGSYGTERYLLSVRSGGGPFRISAHARYTMSHGDFSFLDDAATPLNTLDDRITTRLNNDFESWNIIGRAEIALPRISELRLCHDAVLREGGVPGIGANQSLSARSERNTHITYLRAVPEPILSRRLISELTFFHSWTADRFHDPDGEITAARQETDNRVVVYGGNGRLRIYPHRLPLSFDIFFEGRKERFHPVSLIPAPTEGPDRLRSVRSLSISGDARPAGDRLVLTVGGRIEQHTSEFYEEAPFPWLPPSPTGRITSAERPQAGFRWHLRPYLCLKGNWGRYHRIPTFLELFGNLGSVTGNPDLEPERGTNRDIGLLLRADRFLFLEDPFLELVYLDNEVEDLILFFPNSQYTSIPVNIGSAVIRGFEASFSGSVRKLLGLSGSYALLDGRDTGPIPYYNGNRLAGRPVHQASGRIEFIRTHWKAGYELHFIGSNYLDQANMTLVPARTIHSALLEFSSRGLSISFEGRNLGDDRISDVNGFPLPGRSFYSTVSYTR